MTLLKAAESRAAAAAMGAMMNPVVSGTEWFCSGWALHSKLSLSIKSM
ncbi:hypothetical protein [Desulfatitalea alkaliphila]|uniref:Uncharacterized protein n=1 Tax=Desulfatitalea alkaliphila TaxID=2929485 RepID=A0AA41R2C8_9BACT|nr:hypothetical protein [Desulfatitalea alkaliphila]MCJ8499526.1 hypothetical protein [Desulfatitalea alkaliphila]